jgi:hypothetical protein
MLKAQNESHSMQSGFTRNVKKTQRVRGAARTLATKCSMKLAVLGLLWAMVQPVFANGIYEFSSLFVSHDSQLSLGLVFTTNADVTVGALGYFDENGDGFLTPHTVGIFDGFGALLTSTTLAAGAGDVLDGHFRYHNISPLVLPAGNTYTLAATTGGPADGWAYGFSSALSTGLVVDPSISIAVDAARYFYQADDVLRDPHTGSGYTLYAGPDFEGAGTATAAPEPGSLGLALTAFALGIVARKRGSRT